MLILAMENQDYPFGRRTPPPANEAVVKVQQTVELNSRNRHEVLSKATFIRNLKSRYLIRVDSVLEESGCLHILYEHVFYDFPSFSQQLGRVGVSEQLRGVSEYLGNIGIRVPLSKDRIGFTSQGQLKYFLGMDFEWEENPDEGYLRSFYVQSMQELMEENSEWKVGDESGNVGSKGGMNLESCIDKKWEEDNEKARKSSFATLPTRFNRWKKLDQKLNSLKASGKDHVVEANFRSQSGEMWKGMDNQDSPTKGRMKRFEDRKYSAGNMKLISKLYEKESDIRSEYQSRDEWMRKVENTRDLEVTTKKSKSRLEEMKQREYQELTNSNKNYLKDFMDVLED